MILPEQILADVLLENPSLIPLLSRFDVPFGFGGKSIEEICIKYNVNLSFFLEIVNTYTDPGYEPETGTDEIPLSVIIKYINNTHSFYTEIELPAIEEEINLLLGSSTLNEEQKKLLSGFFNDYKNEFVIHISHEEDFVMPYIQDIQHRFDGRKGNPDRFGTFSIIEYAREHDRLEKSLNDLAKLIIKYLPPVNDQLLCSRILSRLFTLEKDLVEHAYLEDRVLVPRVLVLENSLSGKAK